ncbi:O-antigen/teichoic acid export membrane protein [Arenicella xantha]|uniref:O-antigen/teichoic acid export membrane protein n=2 Tax=Arenicella xantha TaxID=644221 RepID=A0A395JIC8_9GAMM|nr:O-antigen/teichoic acid export membrane protein [Arenicella xantha]
MFSKLVLVLLLTKYSGLEQLGIYGLFVSSVAVLNYLQGLEFYRYTARELSLSDPERNTQMIVNQFAIHLVTYLVILPISVFAFCGNFLPWELLGFFLWISVCSHIGQEANRLLIVFGGITQAYIVSFVVHGLWACIAIAIFFYYPEQANLRSILWLWGASSLVGVVLGGGYLSQYIVLGSLVLKVDYGWVVRGLKVCAKFFVAVMAVKTIELSDRFFLQYYYDEALVGVYTMFGSVAKLVQEFVYTGLIVTVIPLLLSHYREKKFAEYERLLWGLQKNIVIFSLLITVVGIAAMYLLLIYLDRVELKDNIFTYFILLFSAFVINLSMIPYYRLYLAGKEMILAKTALVGMLINTMLNLLLVPVFGAIGAATATIVSFCFIYLANMYLASKYTLRHAR